MLSREFTKFEVANCDLKKGSRWIFCTMKLSYHLSQNIRYKPRIKQFKGEAFPAKVFKRGAEVVENTIIDDQKAVMH